MSEASGGAGRHSLHSRRRAGGKCPLAHEVRSVEVGTLRDDWSDALLLVVEAAVEGAERRAVVLVSSIAMHDFGSRRSKHSEPLIALVRGDFWQHVPGRMNIPPATLASEPGSHQLRASPDAGSVAYRMTANRPEQPATEPAFCTSSSASPRRSSGASPVTQHPVPKSPNGSSATVAGSSSSAAEAGAVSPPWSAAPDHRAKMTCHAGLRVRRSEMRQQVLK